MKSDFSVNAKFICALKGYFFWKRFIHKHSIEDAVVVFVPGSNSEENRCVLKYLDRLIIATNSRRALILSGDKDTFSFIHTHSSETADYIFMTENQINNLLSLCALIVVNMKLFITSLSEPYGRSAGQLIGIHGTTIEQALEFGAFYFPRQTDNRFRSKRVL